jgi:hypothetical protein
MLDPLTSLSLASSIVQFVDFGTRLIAESQQIYYAAGGALKENVELEEIATDLKSLSHNLKSNPFLDVKLPSNNGIGLQDLASSCMNVADELLSVLQDLKIQGPRHRKWQSICQALKSARKRGLVMDFET